MERRNHSWLKVGIWIAGVGAALLIGTNGNLSARDVTAGAASGAIVAQSQANSNPNLAGHWTLNKDQSDDPREKMHEAMGNNGGGNGEGGGGGYGGGGGQGGGGGHHGGGGRGGHGPGGMMADMSQLTIEQTASSVKVSGASGRVLAANPAEQASKPSNGGNGENEGREYTPPVAKWQGSQLTTSNENPRGGSMTRTYELSSDGKQLIVTTKMQNPRMSQPVTIRFVYDQTKASSGSN
jgi:hypothetical protein